MGDYDEPAFSAASSVFLFALGIISICCTIFPVVAMTRIGMKSQQAELTACINFAMTMWTISSLPHVYEHYHLCAVFGFFIWYSIIQLVVTASLMMYGAKAYIMQIQGINDGETLTLTLRQRLLLYLFPAIPPFFPLLTRSYGHMFCWCSIDFDAKYGEESFIILCLAVWVPVLFVIYHYAKVAVKMKNTMTSTEIFYQVALNGPVMYGSATIILLVTNAFYNTIASLIYHNSAKSVYNTWYFFAISVCALGISYGFIFVRNIDHVKAMEAYVRNAHEFHKEFGDSMSEDLGKDRLSLGIDSTLSTLSVPILSDDISLRETKAPGAGFRIGKAKPLDGVV